MADYNSDRTGSNIDLTLDKVDALDAKVQPTATGVDVTGTVTADGLTVDKNYVFQGTNYHFKLGENSGDSYLGSFGNGHFSATGYYYGSNKYQLTGGSTNLTGYAATSDFTIFAEDGLAADSLATSKARLRIDGATGDVQFFEDSGSTAKMVWDASAESLGIGTASPSALVDVVGGRLYVDSADNYAIRVEKNSDVGGYIGAPSSGNMAFYNNAGAESVRIDSSGNVGIGTASPIYPLDVRGQAGIEIYNATGGGGVLNFRPSLGDASKYNLSISSYDHSGAGAGPADGLSINGFDGVSFATGSSTARQERMRIDASGNVGMGTSSPRGNLSLGHKNAGAVYDKNLHFGYSTADYYGWQLRHSANPSSQAAGDFRFMRGTTTAWAESARFDNNGNLLVGQTSATSGYKFQVTGLTQISGANTKIRIGELDSTYAYIQATRGDGNGDVKIFGGLHPQDGVYLGGTGAANKLDDYEIGSWTPSLSFDVGGTGVTTSGSGRYTKVGQNVTVWFSMNVGGTGGNGDFFARLSGIPFNSANLSQAVGRVWIQNPIRPEFNLSTEGGVANLLMYATAGVDDFARGDDLVGQTISGSFTYRTAS